LVKDFGELYTDDFKFSAMLRNNGKYGRNLCQMAQVVILHEDGPIRFPLTDKGCISNISLYAFGKEINGKKADLSGFGTNLENYVKVECISKDQGFTVLLNDNPVYSFDVSYMHKRILGIYIYFQGGGVIKNVVLGNSGSKVYTSDF